MNIKRNTATSPIKRFDTTSAMIDFLSNKLVHVVVINNKNLRNRCKVSEEERERKQMFLLSVNGLL